MSYAKASEFILDIGKSHSSSIQMRNGTMQGRYDLTIDISESTTQDILYEFFSIRAAVERISKIV